MAHEGLEDNVKVGDYIIVLDKDTRKKIGGTCTASKKSQKTLETVDAYGDSNYTDVKIGDDAVLLANLGTNPMTGMVYGTQIRKLHSQTAHNFWGNISIMRDLDDTEKEVLKRGLADGQKVLKNLGLDKAIVMDNLLVMESKGRYAGWYKEDKRGTHIALHPKEFTEAEISYVVHHELGHAIWYQLAKEATKAEWVNLYTQYVDVHRTPDDVLNEVIDIVSAQSRHIDEYYEMLEELEGGDIWFEKLTWALMDIHLLDKQDLDLFLWSLSSKKRRRALERAISNLSYITGEVSTSFPVSDYASKNTREFFAETYAFYLTQPSRIPEDVEELMLRTLPSIKHLKGKM